MSSGGLNHDQVGVDISRDRPRGRPARVRRGRGASFAIAKVLALIFAALFLVFLLLGLAGASRIAT
jgi:hypothetical protein